jgi:hypothetical protein
MRGIITSNDDNERYMKTFSDEKKVCEIYLKYSRIIEGVDVSKG